MRTACQVAGKIVFDMARPDTREKAWYAFGLVKQMAANGSPFMANVRAAIARIAQRLMHKPGYDIGAQSKQRRFPVRDSRGRFTRRQRSELSN